MDWLFKLRSLGYVAVGDDIWYANLYFNALIKQDRQTGRIEVVDRFPDYSVAEAWLYSAVYYVEGCLIFIPNRSEEIVSYHIVAKKFTSVVLDSKLIGERKGYFLNAYVAGQYVYLFPAWADCIVRYDVREQKVKYLQDNLTGLIRRMPASSVCFGQEFATVDGKVYMPFLERNAVAVFDIQSEQVEVRYMDLPEGCSTIQYADGMFYLSAWKTDRIFRWDVQTDEIKIYGGVSESVAKGGAFLRSCRLEDEIIFFPATGNRIIAFSMQTGEIHEVQRIQNVDQEPIGTFCLVEEPGHCYVLTADMECIHSFSYQDGKINCIPCHRQNALYNKQEISNFLMEQGFFDAILGEGKSPVSYLEILTLAEKSGDGRDVKTGSYGKAIWDQICG